MVWSCDLFIHCFRWLIILSIAIQTDVRRRALRKREREAAAAAASSKTQ